MSDDEVVDPKKLLAAKATENECKGALKAYKVCLLYSFVVLCFVFWFWFVRFGFVWF